MPLWQRTTCAEKIAISLSTRTPIPLPQQKADSLSLPHQHTFSCLQYLHTSSQSQSYECFTNGLSCSSLVSVKVEIKVTIRDRHSDHSDNQIFHHISSHTCFHPRNTIIVSQLFCMSTTYTRRYCLKRKAMSLYIHVHMKRLHSFQFQEKKYSQTEICIRYNKNNI